MERDNYSLAGWAMIGSVALFIPAMGLLVFNDVKGAESSVGLLPLAVAFDIASKILGIYAYLRFRNLLNERYDFHAVDTLIPVLIGVGVLTGALSYAARAFGSPIPSMVMGMMTAVIMGVLGIVYARRLLRMNGTLNGYLKPLAYSYLIGSICFVLLVFAPLGLVLFRVGDIILGLAFFKGDELEELEVV